MIERCLFLLRLSAHAPEESATTTVLPPAVGQLRRAEASQESAADVAKGSKKPKDFV
jgi:hypothetical protein